MLHEIHDAFVKGLIYRRCVVAPRFHSWKIDSTVPVEYGWGRLLRSIRIRCSRTGGTVKTFQTGAIDCTSIIVVAVTAPGKLRRIGHSVRIPLPVAGHYGQAPECSWLP